MGVLLQHHGDATSRAFLAGRAEIQRAHISTGRVAVEDVIRFVIMEFGVEPLRPDWGRVLAEARTAFREQRT